MPGEKNEESSLKNWCFCFEMWDNKYIFTFVCVNIYLICYTYSYKPSKINMRAFCTYNILMTELWTAGGADYRSVATCIKLHWIHQPLLNKKQTYTVTEMIIMLYMDFKSNKSYTLYSTKKSYEICAKRKIKWTKFWGISVVLWWGNIKLYSFTKTS